MYMCMHLRLRCVDSLSDFTLSCLPLSCHAMPCLLCHAYHALSLPVLHPCRPTREFYLPIALFVSYLFSHAIPGHISSLLLIFLIIYFKFFLYVLFLQIRQPAPKALILLCFILLYFPLLHFISLLPS